MIGKRTSIAAYSKDDQQRLKSPPMNSGISCRVTDDIDATCALQSDKSQGEVRLSVVIPTYNERESVEAVLEEVLQVLEQMEVRFEVIFVDDGSTDGTDEILLRLSGEPRVRLVSLARNFGKSAALMAGFGAASGRYVVTLDADLQNDPRDIPRLVEQLDRGFGLVCGWRQIRKDPWLNRVVPSFAANWLISRVTGVRLRDYGCGIKAYRQSTLKLLNLYGGMHRFIPALAHSSGVRISEVPVNHRTRKFGASKYNLYRTVEVILDVITVRFLQAHATRPIQFFGFAGLIASGCAVLLGAAALYRRLTFGLPLTQNPTFLVSVILLLGGFLFVGMGLLAEIAVRIYHRINRETHYVLADAVRDSHVEDVE